MFLKYYPVYSARYVFPAFHELYMTMTFPTEIIVCYMGYLERVAKKAPYLVDPAAVHFRVHQTLSRAYLDSRDYDAAATEYETLLSPTSWDQLRIPIW